MTTHSYGETILRVNDVSLSYNGKLILKGVSAEIKDVVVPGRITGQVVGFLGPSGIGKSSLFRIMAGLNSPTSGTVTLGEKGKTVHSGEVGVVAQNYPLFEHRTVMSNLMVAARHKYDEKTALERVTEYLNEFDLYQEMTKYPAQLSGGQRQRCAIIQQIVCSGHLLLMDEPFSGLDPIMKRKTQNLLLKVANIDELNTVVVVSHDIAAIAEISDHIWLLGRDRDADNKIIPGARIVETYDLIERELAWGTDIASTPKFIEFTREIESRFPWL